MREMNGLCVTGVIDAGGGFQNYPRLRDHREAARRDDQLTLASATYLFTQRSPKEELADFSGWVKQCSPGQGDDTYRHNGAGEMLVYSAADFEDFRVERPDMPPSKEGDQEPVIRLLAEHRWPWRLHATYDQTIGRARTSMRGPPRHPLTGINWFFDHAETISDRISTGSRHWRRHRGAAPHGLSGRVFRRTLWPEGRRADAADPQDDRGRHSVGAGTTPRASPATIPGCR